MYLSEYEEAEAIKDILLADVSIKNEIGHIFKKRLYHRIGSFYSP